MSDSKWTPGPWSLWGKADPSQVIASQSELVAQTVGGNDIANARLIAAAPDLYAALERTLNWLSSYPGGGPMGRPFT